jgi:CRISPR-associated endonuclease/helicase Cas3
MSFAPPAKRLDQLTQDPASLELSDCIAKTIRDENGNKELGRTVFSHCLIVGEVARCLLGRFLPHLRRNLFPIGSELIAAAHDVGKISPTFQEKIRRSKTTTPHYIPNSLKGLETVDPDMEENWGGHAGVSELAARAYLGEKYTDTHTCKYIPSILGQHHGRSPSISGRLALDDVFGGEAWQYRRKELFEALEKKLECDWPQIESELKARILAGLTTVSDWIGSGTLFDDPKNENWLPLIEKSIDLAGLIPIAIKPDLSFEEIFGCPPRAIQQRLMEVCQEPGVYVLEAPMGIGKTEAALYTAYQILKAGHASGIYFALPTQLTSEKIHERVERFLEKILPLSCSQSVQLVHGNAWLKSEIGEEGHPGGSWFSSTKRAILAPFGVGTVDQALMAVMNVKHGFVRAFGLVGKVVILDEVHSYDSYTGTILDKLVEALRDLKCTVIILSATLTLERRQALMNGTLKDDRYPLVSVANKGGLSEFAVEPDADSQTIIHFCKEDQSALEEALYRAEKGQQVLWVENTVVEAQLLFLQIAARSKELNIECGLLHSRFLKCDRKKIEDKWVGYFGKFGAEKRKERGRIWVGTQILEQSLDIDADFLITRICPTDMILQRTGRLWRHSETLRPASSLREAWILSPSLESALEDPEKALGRSIYVYSPYILLRSIEIWENLSALSLPGSIRNLIERTHQYREEKGIWQKLQQQLSERRERLQQLAGIGLSSGGKTLPECKASTRYGEIDNVEVLLVREFSLEKNGLRLKFLDGTEIFIPKLSNSNLRLRRQLGASLAKNTLQIHENMAPQAVESLHELNGLEGYIYLGAKDESKLQVAKVLSSEKLVSLNGSNAHPSKHLRYNSTLGYRVDDDEYQRQTNV